MTAFLGTFLDSLCFPPRCPVQASPLAVPTRGGGFIRLRATSPTAAWMLPVDTGALRWTNEWMYFF